MDVLFNAEYNDEDRASVAEQGISLPYPGVCYTVRSVLTCSATGQESLHLNEVVNPVVGWKHPIIGMLYREISFPASEFTTLTGKPLKAKKAHYEEFKELPSPQYIITCHN